MKRRTASGARLKLFLLVSVLSFLPSSLPCFSDVILTDREAEELMSEIEKSRKELSLLQKESKKQIELLETSLKQSEAELESVKSTWQVQKTSYEVQLKEEKNKRILPWTLTGVSSLLSVVLLILLL